MWFNMNDQLRTIDHKNSKRVIVLKHPGNPREKMTVILACFQSGNKLPPAIVVESHKNKDRISIKNSVLIFHHPKTSMMNCDLVTKWLKIIMEKQPEKRMLIMDSFRGHLTFTFDYQNSTLLFIKFNHS